MKEKNNYYILGFLSLLFDYFKWHSKFHSDLSMDTTGLKL